MEIDEMKTDENNIPLLSLSSIIRSIEHKNKKERIDSEEIKTNKSNPLLSLSSIIRSIEHKNEKERIDSEEAPLETKKFSLNDINKTNNLENKETKNVSFTNQSEVSNILIKPADVFKSLFDSVVYDDKNKIVLDDNISPRVSGEDNKYINEYLNSGKATFSDFVMAVYNVFSRHVNVSELSTTKNDVYFRVLGYDNLRIKAGKSYISSINVNIFPIIHGLVDFSIYTVLEDTEINKLYDPITHRRNFNFFYSCDDGYKIFYHYQTRFIEDLDRDKYIDINDIDELAQNISQHIKTVEFRLSPYGSLRSELVDAIRRREESDRVYEESLYKTEDELREERLEAAYSVGLDPEEDLW